jgi:hypothetical protein
LRSTFSKRTGAALDDVQQELSRAFDEQGEGAVSRFLDGKTIFTVETRIPHGCPTVPRWRAFNLQGNAVVWQTQAADAKFLYLVASAQVMCGIEVW